MILFPPKTRMNIIGSKIHYSIYHIDKFWYEYILYKLKQNNKDQKQIHYSIYHMIFVNPRANSPTTLKNWVAPSPSQSEWWTPAPRVNPPHLKTVSWSMQGEEIERVVFDEGRVRREDQSTWDQCRWGRLGGPKYFRYLLLIS